MSIYEQGSWTGHKSGYSAASALGKSPNTADDFIVALIENRACEVGIAIFNLETFQLSIGQLSDTIGFSKTVSFLHSRNPSNFIFSHTSVDESSLFQVISQHFDTAALTSVNRRVFNDVNGGRRLMELSSNTQAIGFIADSANYLALGASAALVQFVEESLLCTLVPNTIKVVVIELDHYVSIDRASSIALKIVPISKLAVEPSLLSVCNHTLTPGGSRLLRSNVVQPIRDVPTLQFRQRAVMELRVNQQLLRSLRMALRRCSHFDVDRLITIFSRQKGESQRVDDARQIIESTIALRNVLEVSKDLVSVLSAFVTEDGSQLLQASCKALSECEPERLLEFIDVHFDSSVSNSSSGRRPQGALLQVHHCFGLRSDDPFSLLELKRRSFSDSIEEIFAHCEALKTQYSIPGLRVTYRPPRGYVLTLPLSEEHKLPMGDYFSRVVHSRTLTCVSHTLLRLNDKLATATRDILAACESTLSSLLPYFWSRVGHLHAIAETLALLDVLQSHASLAQQFKHCVCVPSFSENNTTRIRSAFPVVNPAGKEPNSLELCADRPLLTITGPNASGKTSVLITFSHMLILTFLGSLIPAREAIIAPCDRFVAVMPSSDAVDVGTSSFVKEMRHLSHLSQSVSKRSLVLVDELGRGTSSAEGSAVACATAEWLVDVGCHSIFTTHSAHLAQMSQSNAHMQVMHMRVTTTNGGSMRYHFQLTEGANSVENYGLRLLSAIQSDSSEKVLQCALSFLAK